MFYSVLGYQGIWLSEFACLPQAGVSGYQDIRFFFPDILIT